MFLDQMVKITQTTMLASIWLILELIFMKKLKPKIRIKLKIIHANLDHGLLFIGKGILKMVHSLLIQDKN
jgi:hypothetical protein